MKSWPSYLIFETEDQAQCNVQPIKTISLTNNPFIRKSNIAKKSFTAEISKHQGDQDAHSIKTTHFNSSFSISASFSEIQQNLQDQIKAISIVYNDLPQSLLDSINRVLLLQSAKKSITPACEELSSEHKKCIFLDLDETIICTKALLDDQGLDLASLEFRKFDNYMVIKRPYLDLFLENLGNYYDIYVFTSSTKQYASCVISYINEKKKFIRGFYCRDQCTLIRGIYVKDISICGRNLNDVAIVDNSIESFGLHVDNGMYIKPFNGLSNDDELLPLMDFLVEHATAYDIRKVIQNSFCLFAAIEYSRLRSNNM